MNTYFIPHNFTNNGRIWGMFRGKDVRNALFWMVPVTALIFFCLPLSFNGKVFCEILLAIPPALGILLGYLEQITHILKFSKNKRVCTRANGGKPYVFVYQTLIKKRSSSKP